MVTMNKSRIWIGILCLIGTSAAHAAFTLVDNFENGQTPTQDNIVFIDSQTNGTGLAAAGSIAVIQDPYGPATNHVLSLNPGTYTNGTGNNNDMWALPVTPIAQTATLFYRFAASQDSNDSLVGSQFQASTANADPTLTYSNFCTICRHFNDGTIDYYDGNTPGYQLNIPGNAYPSGHWLKVWQVINAATNSYNVYLQSDGSAGLPWGTQTLITNVGGITSAGFRNIGNYPIAFVASEASSDGLSLNGSILPSYVDDINVDYTGQNLTDPTIGTVVPASPTPTPSSTPAPTPTPTGSPTPTPAPTPTPSSTPPPLDTGNLGNVSTSTNVGPGGVSMGFVVGSPGRMVLVRADGPGLAALNVSGVLANPVLTLYSLAGGKSVQIATNIGWGNAPTVTSGWGSAGNVAALQAAFTATGAFQLQTGSADSAILINLPSGNYTATITGANGTTGVGLIEVYLD